VVLLELTYSGAKQRHSILVAIIGSSVALDHKVESEGQLLLTS